MLPLFPVALVVRLVSQPFDRRGDWYRTFVATWVSMYGRLTPLYGFRIEGRERIPARGGYVLVANHESGLDTLAVMMLRTPARILGNLRHLRIPIAGLLFRSLAVIPVKPGDRQSGRAAIEEIEASLRAGTPVVVFPEGDLFPDTMGDFRSGAFVAAKRAGVPLIPLLLEGMGRAWRPGTMVVHGRHELRIAVLDPIDRRTVEASTVSQLADLARDRIVAARARR